MPYQRQYKFFSTSDREQSGLRLSLISLDVSMAKWPSLPVLYTGRAKWERGSLLAGLVQATSTYTLRHPYPCRPAPNLTAASLKALLPRRSTR
jgi:hypothetical protein